jgi:citrate synthase
MNVMNGLEGVVAAETRLSMVDGERGELVIGGFRVEELASWRFEDVVELLWQRPATRRASAITDPQNPTAPLMDALRAGIAALSAENDEDAASLLL